MNFTPTGVKGENRNQSKNNWGEMARKMNVGVRSLPSTKIGITGVPGWG